MAADPATEGEVLCDRALTAVRRENADMKDLLVAQKNYASLMEKQRDDALKDLERERPLLPWYVWSAIGAAAGVVVVGGLRR